MKRNALLSSLLLILVISLSCEDSAINPSVNFPDFSNCNCDFESRDFVCTEDGRWFRSSCFASCIGLSDSLINWDSCDMTSFEPDDYLTWPINFICNPVLPSPPKVLSLSDSTHIFQINDNTQLRGVEIQCLCLSPETMIATPEGERKVSTMKVGDAVLSQNLAGEIEFQELLHLRKNPSPLNHKILHLCLEDGRQIHLSPNHPAINYRPIEKWEIGEYYDGSQISGKVILPYTESYTWDILPAGKTGLYKANGIWMGSTLFNSLELSAQILP
ncbi:MAG: hypothetical protein AAF696_14270 [Bacteroidota bacterium]